MRRQPISKGFGAGLQIWLLFLLSFYWIGYPALFSIAIGAIGGLASGFVVDWWLSKEEKTEPERQPMHAEGTEDIARIRQRQRRNSALRHRQRRQESRSLNWRKLFRRNNEP